MKKIFLKLLLLLVISIQAHTQINDSLGVLCDEVEIQNYIWDEGTPYRLKSVNYDFKINNDSLVVKIDQLNIFQNNDSTIDSSYSNLKYKAKLRDIGSIKLHTKLIKLEHAPSYHDSKVEIEVSGDESLFDIYYENGVKRKTWHIPVRIFRHSDTTKFQTIVDLLNGYIIPENNPNSSKCVFDGVHEWSGISINAIENSNLDIPTVLNGNSCNEKSINELLIEYMKEQNIKSLAGYGVIKKNNQFHTLWLEQYSLFKFVNSRETLPPGYKTIIKNIGTIDDNQMDEIQKILKSQIWKAGFCEGESVDSYFDFIVKNEEFKRTQND